MKKWRKAVLIAILVMAALCAWRFAHSPESAAAAFRWGRADFERAAAQALAAGSGEEVKLPAGVHRIAVEPDPTGRENCVEFEMGGAGMGSSTAYWGVTFSRGGSVGLDGVALDYVPHGGGWLWEESGGDNWSRVIRLEENWYLYEMHF